MPFCGCRQTFCGFLQLCVLDLEEIAGQYLPILATQMHGAALAVTPDFAVGALILLHPFAVAVQFETVFPQIPEVVGMDVALVVVTANAQAT